MSDLKAKLSQFFSEHKVLNLAYVDENGVSQSCALWMAHNPNNLEIYVLSSLSTKHGKTLQEGGKVSFTINKDEQNWRHIRGVQGRGYISISETPDAAWEIYSTKFEFVKQQFPELEDALEKTKIWKIQPKWLRFIDNSISFGHKEELEL